MISEFNKVRKYFEYLFSVDGEVKVPDGVYAVPTRTSKGDAFMKMEMKDNQRFGGDNFKLFWDEALTISWYDNPNPEPDRFDEYNESEYRLLEQTIGKTVQGVSRVNGVTLYFSDGSSLEVSGKNCDDIVIRFYEQETP